MSRRTRTGAGGVPPRGERARILRQAQRQMIAERLRQQLGALPERSPSPWPDGELERRAAIEEVCQAVRRVVAEEPSLTGWRCEFVTYLDGHEERDEVTVRLEVQVFDAAARGNRDA